MISSNMLKVDQAMIDRKNAYIAQQAKQEMNTISATGHR
jgi:hypothetical protein